MTYDKRSLQPGSYNGEADVFVLRDILEKTSTRAEAAEYLSKASYILIQYALTQRHPPTNSLTPMHIPTCVRTYKHTRRDTHARIVALY